MANLTNNKQGGRPKGVKNKRPKILRMAKEYDILPLAYMLETLNNTKNDDSDRMDAAKAAAPYIHPKLANIEMKHDGGLEIVNRIERSIVKANAKDS